MILGAVTQANWTAWVRFPAARVKDAHVYSGPGAHHRIYLTPSPLLRRGEREIFAAHLWWHEAVGRRAAILAASSAGILARRALGRQDAARTGRLEACPTPSRILGAAALPCAAAAAHPREAKQDRTQPVLPHD